MDVEAGEEQKPMKNVMCLLSDPEGAPLGPSMYLPENVGPVQLQEVVNQLLKNVSFSPTFSFGPVKPVYYCGIVLCVLSELLFSSGGEIAICILHIRPGAAYSGWFLLGEEQRYPSLFFTVLL